MHKIALITLEIFDNIAVTCKNGNSPLVPIHATSLELIIERKSVQALYISYPIRRCNFVSSDYIFHIKTMCDVQKGLV